MDRGDSDLADLVYSGVPAGQFGMEQVIEIGPMSGMSNVRYWMKARGIEKNEDAERALFEAAKSSDRILTEPELMAVLDQGEAHV